MIRDRVWATTARIPTTDGPVWFKACAESHRFEAELVAALARGRPDLLPRVLACAAARGWLLTADAGTSFEDLGNPPELWLRLLPRYAELQREAAVASAVPDRTVPCWPELYDELAASELPLGPEEAEQLRRLAPTFAELCAELAGHGLPAAVQHDDLHPRTRSSTASSSGSLTGGRGSLASVRVARGDVSVPGGAQRDLARRQLGRAAARRVSRAVGDRSHRRVRAGAVPWRIRARVRLALPAAPAAAGGGPAYDVPFAVVLRRALSAFPDRT